MDRGNTDPLTCPQAKSIMNTMMHLRKVCNHPYLFPEVEEAFIGDGQQYGDHLFRTCAKFELLDRLLPKVTGHIQSCQSRTVAMPFLHRFQAACSHKHMPPRARSYKKLDTECYCSRR